MFELTDEPGEGPGEKADILSGDERGGEGHLSIRIRHVSGGTSTLTGFAIGLLTLLAVLCPPLAVLGTGGRTEAAKNLGLTTLLYVPGVLHALRTVDDHVTQQRFAVLLQAIEAERAG